MTAHMDFVTTGLGEFSIWTRGAGLFRRKPNTSIVPQNALNLARYSLALFWSTNDADLLLALHRIVLKVLQEPNGVDALIVAKYTYATFQPLLTATYGKNFKLSPDMQSTLVDALSQAMPSMERRTLETLTSHLMKMR